MSSPNKISLPSVTFETLSAGVRKKPGMYYGTSGSNAIPRMLDSAIEDLLQMAPAYRGLVEVKVSLQNEITICCRDLRIDTYTSIPKKGWFEHLDIHVRKGGLNIGLLACASKKFAIEASDGSRQTILSLADNKPPFIRSRLKKGKPFVRIAFVSAIAGGDDEVLTHDHLYNIASRLKDASLLRPGLKTSLLAEHFDGEIRYYYKNGLRSLMIEDDHTRWPLHRECITFTGHESGMSVEGCLRFLHAGPPYVRSYVNFYPSQGGAHHEGLGRALTKVFPDPTRGCRQVLFVTNSNTSAVAKLPHSFIGAMHLQVDDPRYEGPTKDILIGDDIRDFVARVAEKQVKEQWDKFQK